MGKQKPQCDAWELSICGSFCTTLFEGGKDFMQIMEMKWNKNATENWVNLCLAVVLCIKTLFLCVFIIFCYVVCSLLFRVYWLKVFCSVLRFLVTPPVIFTWCNIVKLKNKKMSVILQGWWRDWTPVWAKNFVIVLNRAPLMYLSIMTFFKGIHLY